MPRPLLARTAALSLLLVTGFAFAEPPKVVRESMTAATQRLNEGRPTDAVLLLERALPHADGDPEFRDLLKLAYAAELKHLTDPKAIEATKKSLALLGGSMPSIQQEPRLPAALPTGGALPPPSGVETPLFPTDSPLPPPTTKPLEPNVGSDSTATDLLRQATASFNLARTEPHRFAEARELFDKAAQRKATMTAEQKTAWAYCRLKVATDQLNRSADARTAANLAQEIEEALTLSADHSGLQAAGREILATAIKRAGSLASSQPKPITEGSGWQILETESFTVKYQSKAGLAENLAQRAEEKRNAIFARWSALPVRKWQPRCEIVLHPNADTFARATKLPSGSTGRADVTLTDGEVASRRMDLRADDATVLEDALPRELTHVILADLFPSQAPPKWAAQGMAVLSESPEQLGRYRRTVARCERDGELIPVGKILSLTEVPPKSVTGFAVESVSLVDFLVRWKGEKHFIGFLRDAQRYGIDSGLKRQYAISDARQLETEWRKNVLGK